MNNLRSKMLYSNVTNNIKTQVRCWYNLKTNNIRIGSYFSISSPGNYSKTNIDCSTYLGITIAEQILSKIFTNVKIMPHNNPGYDFICGKGYKVDVKSATLTKNTNTWQFTINKNKISDYFLCLAFDNRINFNPQHLWLIPSKLINNKLITSISKSTSNKWLNYELTNKLDDIIICCNKMRGI